jgi:CRISPR-associated endonuclease/helicase Cas3
MLYASGMEHRGASQFFRKSYPALTGHPESFPWQEELFLRFCEPDIPSAAVLPTGCGKTSVMAVWVLALAWQARKGPQGIRLPRRLVWVVNRRVVVDQATVEATEIRDNINDKSLPALDTVREALRELSRADDIIGVSGLRGQLADNAEWRDDPARPAIVVGTVDMIGSRLLFSGYGSGFKYRPLHAGFVGQDALIVHDEAHLEPAFQRLIEAVMIEQGRCQEFRPFHVMALTATSRDGSEKSFGLTEADRVPGSEIRKRIEARKGISFHGLESEKKLAGEIVERALEFQDSGRAILIFLRKLQDVHEAARKLKLAKQSVQVLTGTMRGHERDQMAKMNPIFARFVLGSPAPPAEGTVYMVCTSAGEVGVNMSADDLVCDLTPFESMTQRFGRVNRFGNGDARIELVWSSASDESAYERQCGRTLALLQNLPQRPDGRYDASPAALENLPAAERRAAFTPEPDYVPTSEVLFDAWALTSVREKMPGRPPVGDWLHGVVTEWEPPQTYVAWREEVGVIDEELGKIYSPKELEELLEDYPLKPHELLRDTSRRVTEHLKEIAERTPSLRVWLIDS